MHVVTTTALALVITVLQTDRNMAGNSTVWLKERNKLNGLTLGDRGHSVTFKSISARPILYWMLASTDIFMHNKADGFQIKKNQTRVLLQKKTGFQK